MTPLFLEILFSLICLVHTSFAWNAAGYAPSKVSCPSQSKSLVRRAHELSQRESEWVDERHKITNKKLQMYLERVGMQDLNVKEFLKDTNLNIGLAFSGGGYRAMLAGAGELAALDERTDNSMKPGGIGGILQSSTYIAGLSGGNWLVGSVALNNFSSVQDLQYDKNTWDLTTSIYDPKFILANLNKITSDIQAKASAKFRTSATDLWSRQLSIGLIGLPNGGPELQFSDIREYDVFKSHLMPYPISVAVGREEGTKIISTNSTVFEMTPFELGSWDPSVFAFTDTKYLGTLVDNGIPINPENCVTGFDNAGFIMGTSSSLFNQFILRISETSISGVLLKILTSILEFMDSTNYDIAIYEPNPFSGLFNSAVGKSKYLALVDGGEDNQNVPVSPLIQPVRQMDAIIAYDNSADIDNYPAGLSLAASYQRQFGVQSNHTMFPSVPDPYSFRALGLHLRPVFFGCYSSNFTGLKTQLQSEAEIPPLLVWNSNRHYSYASNVSTFKMAYSTEEVAGMIQNGYEVATRNNGTDDSEWGACIGCAIIQREVERRGIEQTEQCQRCFQKYCWDGTTVPSPSEALVSSKKDSSKNTKGAKNGGNKRRSLHLEEHYDFQSHENCQSHF